MNDRLKIKRKPARTTVGRKPGVPKKERPQSGRRRRVRVGFLPKRPTGRPISPITPRGGRRGRKDRRRRQQRLARINPMLINRNRRSRRRRSRRAR